MSVRVLSRLNEALADAVLETGSPSGDDFAVVTKENWVRAAAVLRDDATCAMDMFIDLTCVDYPKRAERFEVWLRLYSTRHKHRFCLKTRVSEEDPTLPSLFDLWKGINWFEREAFDLFGVRFLGHPDLRRILLYDEFVGSPLRKDYSASHTQPLQPYRDAPATKVPPFDSEEGMPWTRR